MLHISDVVFDRTAPYDVVIATCGYERRSSYLCRIGLTRAAHKYAVSHPGAQTNALIANRTLYEREDWHINDLTATLSACGEYLSTLASARLCIDISSMPRGALAAVVEWLITSLAMPLDITFAYCPADFTASALAASRVEPLSAAPVSAFFSGELRAPSIPIGLIVGLGLEPHRAIGLVEFLEPAQTWAFISESLDSRFDAETESLHAGLLGAPEGPATFRYDVRSLAHTYAALDSLVFSAGLKYRLMMAPSGPKMFTLACLLVAAPRTPERPAVWRVGAHNLMTAVDVVEAGDIIAARVVINNSPVV
jgi:hypothetical protein